jgi:orotidine-5'-phosphate decarboxylase
MRELRSRLIVALDHPNFDAAIGQVEGLGELVSFYKVGLELFTATGPTALFELRARKKSVFLDLKIHDIPETAYRATKVASALGAALVTVHAAGGVAMMERAVAGAGEKTGILAVTVLTSLERVDLDRDGHPLSVEALVVRRARLAQEAGCAGVVASPREVAAIRAAVRPDFLIVTPGVRPDGAGGDDQKRVATARQAIADGASAVVVGRPIRDAASPREAAASLLRELEI